MALDLGEIEVLLQTLAKHLSASCGKLIVELEETGGPETREEQAARDALVASIQRKGRECARVEAQLLEVRRELLGTTEETFTGSWPPSDPASLSAQWAALLDEADELPEEYLGEGHFDEGSPLREAWEELDAALLAFDPREPVQAQAILSAAERDWFRAGGHWHWDAEFLETARAHRPTPSWHSG